MPPTRTTVYLDQPAVDRLEWLTAEYGLGTSAACRVGLGILVATLKDESRAQVLDSENVKRKGRTMFYDGDDRVKQVGVISDMAADIRFSSDDPNHPVGERVDYYLAHTELPSWFDDHDRYLLTEFASD